MSRKYRRRLEGTDPDVKVFEDTFGGTDLLDPRDTLFDQPLGNTKTGLHMGLTVLFGDWVVEFQSADTFSGVNIRKLGSR